MLALLAAWALAADSLNVRTVGSWNYGPCRAAAGCWIGGHRYAVISSGQRLQLLNIDAPPQPRPVGDLSLAAEITRIWAGGNWAYTVVDGIGVTLVDIADPARPVLRGTLPTAGAVKKALRFGDHLAIAAGAAGLLVADIADPANPRLSGQCALAGPALDVALDAGSAYVACGAAGLRRVSLLDPANPAETGHCPLEGSANGVEIQGGHAFLAGDGGLAIVSIDSLALTVRCPVDRPLAQAQLYGDFAIGSDDGGGVRIIEFQDLTDIGQTGYYQLPFAACQLTVLDSLALLADSLQGLRILDLSSLRHLGVANAWHGSDTAYAVLADVMNTHAYLAAGLDGLRLFNIENSSHPIELGAYNPGSRVYQAAQLPVDTLQHTWSDSLLCVAAGDSGLALLDITDPKIPRERMRLRGFIPAYDVSMASYITMLPDTIVSHNDSDTTYIDTTRIVAAVRGDSSVWFFKLTDDSTLQLLGPVSRDHPVYNVQAFEYGMPGTDNTCCLYYCSGGHTLFDYGGTRYIDTLLHFRSLASAVTPGWVRRNAARLDGATLVGDTLMFFTGSGVYQRTLLPGAVEGGHQFWESEYYPAYYDACDGQQGFHFFTSGGTGIAHFATPGQCRDMALVGRTALIADGAEGLLVADLSRLNTLTEQGQQPVTLATGALAAVPGHAYVAGASPSLTALDLSDSSRPRMTAYTPLPQPACGMTISDSLLLIADGDSGLLVAALSDPGSPVRVGTCLFPGVARSVLASGETAYVAADTAGMSIIDLSDPSHPLRQGGLKLPGTAFGVALCDHFALVAAGNAGIQIVNIADPLAPALAGSFPVTGYSYGIVTSGNLALVAAGANGLAVLDIADPVHPALIGGLAAGGYARQLCLRDSVVYLADGEGGLTVINISDPRQPVEVGNYRPGRQVWSAVLYGGCVLTLDDAAAVRLLWPYWTARQPYVPPETRAMRFENAPNPFNARTWVQYSIDQPSLVNVAVYNIQGQLVATLVSGQQRPGSYRVSWDGKNGNGRPLASGVYLCRLQAGANRAYHKIVLLR